MLGSTGAGLDPLAISRGSPIANVIGIYQLCYYVDYTETCHAAGIRSEWPWWDDLHAFWRELPNYNPQGVQSSEPGTMHASDAAALFAAPGDEDEDIEDDIDGVGGEDNPDVAGEDSRGGSPSIDEEDEGAIPVSNLFINGGVPLT